MQTYEFLYEILREKKNYQIDAMKFHKQYHATLFCQTQYSKFKIQKHQVQDISLVFVQLCQHYSIKIGV